MSSSTRKKVSSLSGLAEMLLRLSELLHSMVGQNLTAVTLVLFEDLRDLINELQVACPNHDGVNKARALWYEMAIASWERHIVERILKSEWYRHDWFPQSSVQPEGRPFIAGQDVLSHFLRRSYLKERFPEMYGRLHKIYSSLATASELNSTERLSFQNLAKGLEQDLLEGRF